MLFSDNKTPKQLVQVFGKKHLSFKEKQTYNSKPEVDVQDICPLRSALMSLPGVAAALLQ